MAGSRDKSTFFCDSVGDCAGLAAKSLIQNEGKIALLCYICLQTFEMDIRRYIPNLLTLLNLFSGCVALVFAFDRQFGFALFFVALGIFFDFFDGFFARLFRVSGPLGVQLDSLADMVTSGVVPGVTMFYMMTAALHKHVPEHLDLKNPYLLFCFLAFLITLGACYRLAKFNIDTRQTNSFIGLPTPANCLFIVSLPVVRNTTDSIVIMEALLNPYFLLAITLFSTWIMNAELPLFSLKIKKFDVRAYALQFFFLAVCGVLLLVFWVTALPLIILFYILLSVARNKLVSDHKATGA